MNADASSGAGTGALGAERARVREGVSNGDADWVLGIDRIAAAVRGAGSDQRLIPTGPERRRIGNLSTGWSVAIPAMGLVMPIVVAIFSRYFGLAELEDLAGTLGVRTSRSGSGWLALFYFVPFALFVLSMGCVLVAALGASFGNPTGWKRRGSNLAYGGFALAAILGVLMVVVGVGGDMATHAIIWLTCVYVVALATFLYQLVGLVPGVDLELRDYVASVTVGFFVTVGAFSMVIGIDNLREMDANGTVGTQLVQDAGVSDGTEQVGLAGKGSLVNSDGPLVNGTGSAGEVPGGTKRAEGEDSGSSAAQDSGYLILAVLFGAAAFGYVISMVIYHRIRRWQAEWNVYSQLMCRIAQAVVPPECGGGKDSRDKACQKIGNLLGPGVSRSLSLDYSVYVGSALGTGGQEMSGGFEDDEDGVLVEAFFEGVKAVFDWCNGDRSRWSSLAYEYVYVRVTHGIAVHLYRKALERGHSWPFNVDADVLASSRLLAIDVAGMVYGAKIQRVVRKRKN